MSTKTNIRGKMTLEELERCEKYAEAKARHLYKLHGVSPTYGSDDAHDVCTDLFLGKERPWRTATDARHRKALICICIGNRLKGCLRKRLTLSEQPMTRAVSVDEAPHGDFDEDGNETNIESALISDEGHQAELICELDDPTGDPAWVEMTRETVGRIETRARRKTGNADDDRLARAEARVSHALPKALTRSVAMSVSETDERCFTLVLKNFQVRFAQCFRAWRASRRFFEKSEI